MLSRSPRQRPITPRHAKLRPRNLITKKNRKVEFIISQVPHTKQRYETVGDWIPGKPAEIRVSRMEDQRYVFLVALHEMIEYELCKKNGISDNEVVAFDVNFEAERRRNMHPIEAEPGNDPRAPYRDEHDFATVIEMMVAQKLGVKWSAYEKALLSLAPKRRVMVRPLIKDSVAASRLR
jgi:hypothetical protein